MELSGTILSKRVQGTERKDDDLPGIDGGNNTCLVVELVTSHGQQPSAPLEFSNTFKKGNIAEADEAMAAYFEARLDAIERFLTGSLPTRAKVIGSAF